MKRNIDGLRIPPIPMAFLMGIYLVRLVRMRFRKYAPKACYSVALSIIEPKHFAANIISSRIFCHAKALGSRAGFYAISGTTQNFSAVTKWMRNEL